MDVTVRRPGWLGWALGETRTEHLTLRAPVAQVSEHWMTVPPGAPVRVSFDEPVSAVAYGSTGSLTQHTAERRPELDLARGPAGDRRRGDRRRAAPVGEARRSHAGELVPALGRPGDGQPARRGRADRSGHADLPDVLKARRRSARLGAPADRAEHAGPMARSEQPYARVHPLGVRRCARLAAAGAAPPSRRGDRRLRERAARHQPGRMDGAARLDAAPAAAARRDRLPPGRLASVGRRGGAHAERAGAGGGRSAERQLQLALPEHARDSCRRCGARGSGAWS